MSQKMFLLALSEANDPQRDAVQAIVKAHAVAWWHYFPDIWLVEGHDHIYWRDLIKPVLLLSPAHVISFQLPATKDERMWAMTGIAGDRTKWLFESYTGVPPPEGVKVPALPKAPGIPKAS
jgi:hypothetical protein